MGAGRRCQRNGRAGSGPTVPLPVSRGRRGAALSMSDWVCGAPSPQLLQQLRRSQPLPQHDRQQQPRIGAPESLKDLGVVTVIEAGHKHPLTVANRRSLIQPVDAGSARAAGGGGAASPDRVIVQTAEHAELHRAEGRTVRCSCEEIPSAEDELLGRAVTANDSNTCPTGGRPHRRDPRLFRRGVRPPEPEQRPVDREGGDQGGQPRQRREEQPCPGPPGGQRRTCRPREPPEPRDASAVGAGSAPQQSAGRTATPPAARMTSAREGGTGPR